MTLSAICRTNSFRSTRWIIHFLSNRTITNSASATGQLTAGAKCFCWCIIKQYCNIHLSRTSGVTLTGPAKGYISRNYYSTKYCDSGTYKVVRTTNLTGATKIHSSIQRTYKCSQKIVNWSQDIN